ncbi:MAG: phytoene desaturase family protein [Vicingaceae bacterium]|nr:phytoene desaturase family protein [Vicingaceae bacterium]
MVPKKIAVIGSGFSGLSAAAYLSQKGYAVDVYEKNETFGGRARQFEEGGFVFDMGPSWYWMPEVIEKFYNDFGYTTSDFYDLKRLSPGFKMVFNNKEELIVPDSYDDLKSLFESVEKGSSKQLDIFMKDAKAKYDISFTNLIEHPGISIMEYANFETVSNAIKLNIFSSYEKLVQKHFKNEKLRSLMEFPVLFLGAMPKDTPSLYSLMNYAGLKLGTWYPMGGFYSVVKAMKKICEDQGVNFHSNSTVSKIDIKYNEAINLQVDSKIKVIDGVVGSADYHHIESKLLDEEYRNYNEKYWSKKTFAPSSLIFYLGVDKKLPNLEHHTLFFDTDFSIHADEIYKDKKWPNDPLFYVCAPSKTDDSVSPKGCENLFILIPLATGLEDNESLREGLFDKVIKRVEKYINEPLSSHIIFKKSFCVNDFTNDYNAYGGNAYGLANTLNQTAILKPKIINRKIDNLVYTGQLTVPGPGVPPSIISGKIAANILNEKIK